MNLLYHTRGSGVFVLESIRILLLRHPARLFSPLERTSYESPGDWSPGGAGRAQIFG